MYVPMYCTYILLAVSNNLERQADQPKYLESTAPGSVPRSDIWVFIFDVT